MLFKGVRARLSKRRTHNGCARKGGARAKTLIKTPPLKRCGLTHCCKEKGARRQPCRESYFLFLGTVRMGEDIPSEGEQPPSQEQSQEQSLPNSLPNAAMSMSAAHTSRLHEDTSHT